ncbi:ATP-binding protein, partial [Archangium sp.]|uniref:ATP-binding protein n=1 Tax=Archangium sp. TaxID=1872627 RepID=UPI002ED894A7
AGRLLHQLEQAPASFVVMDEVTAGLLGSGFQLSRTPSGTFLLQGEQLGADESRPLLGRPTACVGREQELVLLEFTLTSSAEEPAARAVLVTAPAGTGKSRLRHEFLRRVERRAQPPLVLLGRADPMSAGASYGLLGQALRRLCSVGEGDNLDARRNRLYQRVAQHLPEAQAQEIVEFLGELCAIPFPEEGSPRLRAARGDPRLMSAQVGKALAAFLQAECAHSPVLLVLEDLHWSDELTVKLVDELLRELAEQPFMVLALARPDVKELFPGLWSRRVQELALHGLSRKAGARLIREVLGAQVPEAVVQRVVDQSDGNALFLEELIRMAAEGRGEEAPETVLAVLQARLMRMEPGGRQVLLAASLFGRNFWAGGVKALLGGQGGGERLEHHLRVLVEQEIIEPLLASRFSSEAEYRFRHVLVRDAAYELVPDSHRPMGHRLAGAWLEQVGESDPLPLATHHQLGQQPERAAHFYTRAAEQLFERNALQRALWCVEAALACGVSGEPLIRLRAIQSVVVYWMNEWPSSVELGLPVVGALKAGSSLWCRLISNLCIATAHAESQEQADRLCELLMCTSPEPEAASVYIQALSQVASTYTWSGDRHRAEALLGRVMEAGAAVFAQDPWARGWMRYAKCSFLYFFEARPWQAFTMAEMGIRDFHEIGAERDAGVMQTLSGMLLFALGDHPDALARLRECLQSGLRSEQHLTVLFAQLYLSLALACSSEPAHQQEAFLQIFDWMGRNSHSSRLGLAYAMLARVIAGTRGGLHEAEAYARQACELLGSFKSYLGFARAVFSDILLVQGRAAEAREVAELGVRELEQMGSQGVYAVTVRLALAEACFAQGNADAGEAALREALRCVRARASDIPDDATRERFLNQVPENARTLALARERWGESAA